MSAAPKAMPIIGPITTPAIQAWLFDAGFGMDVIFVTVAGAVALALKGTVEVSEVGFAIEEAVPINVVSKKIVSSCRLATYYSIGL